jgi:hypothetical protein
MNWFRLLVANAARRALEWAEGPQITGPVILDWIREMERQAVRDVADEIRQAGGQVTEIAPGIYRVQQPPMPKRSRAVH